MTAPSGSQQTPRTVRGLQLDTASPQTLAEGMIVWNNGDRVPQFQLKRHH
jgi:hypothetical protein